MSYIKQRLSQFLTLFHSIKDSNLAWQSENQEKSLELSRRKTLAKKHLAGELTKKHVELAHELRLIKTRQSAELMMLKTRCAEDIKDYGQYLSSLEQLKFLTRNSFRHLPEPLVLTIHHHAKSLLNKMWEAESLDDKIKLETQLIKFMMTVNEEAQLSTISTTKKHLPENTLKLIENRDV